MSDTIQNPFAILVEQNRAIEEKLDLLINSNGIVPEIIDRAELCKRLGISEPTAIMWDKKRKIPSFRIGSAVRYNWPKVLDALENAKGKTVKELAAFRKATA